MLVLASIPACSLQRTPSNSVPRTLEDFFSRCPTAGEVAQVDADFQLGFEYDPTEGQLACQAAAGSADLTLLQKRVYQTIYVMRLLSFTRPLPWTEKPLYDWLVDAIDGVRFVDGGGGGRSFCCEPEDTIVIALNPDSELLQADEWVTGTQAHGLMDSVLLYAHEARHNEGFHHVCTGRSGDDNTLTEMGSWAIDYYLALWIAQYGDRDFLRASGSDPDRYRRAALDHAQVTRLTRFCEDLPIGPEPTLSP
jgi:hypothetical protein